MSIENELYEIIKKFPEEYHEEKNTRTIWGEPLIGVADAADPKFADLKTIISPSHALPGELVEGAKSVLCYFVPFDHSINSSNIEGEESSEEWDYAYIETNNMLNALCIKLHDFIVEKGYDASNIPATYNYDPVALKSDWSHRSAAYIAGLGTFGINNMLITEKGCCGRVGSVITTVPMMVTERPKYEFCLFKNKGTCGKCLSRCPIQAYTYCEDKKVEVEGSQLEKGGATAYGVYFDRNLCNYQIYEKIVPKYDIGDGDTCGKCMVGVPCSNTNPCKR